MSDHKKKWLAFGTTAIIILILDQVTKYLVRTTPDLQSMVLVPGWLEFYYTRNPGMAMGISWADTWVISLVAIAAAILIFFYIWKTSKLANMGYMICMGLIMGGAFGNISDRIFLSKHGVLNGAVVDFIYFSLRLWDKPVFPYIFNFADAAISVAIVTLIVFYKKLLPPEEADLEKEKTETFPETASEETHSELS